MSDQSSRLRQTQVEREGGRRSSPFISIFSRTPLTDCALSDLCCVERELGNGSLPLQLGFFENKNRSMRCQQVRHMALNFMWSNQLSKCIANIYIYIQFILLGLFYFIMWFDLAMWWPGLEEFIYFLDFLTLVNITTF